MPNHLSILGIIHTAISIIAIIVALYALIRDGQINPKNGSGKLYILLTIITCITALPIMRTGHPTAGHNLAVIILIVLPIAVYAPSFKFLGKSAAYIQIFLMSLTLFFSFIPAIVETLTRVPISRPIADGPNSPVIKMGLLILVVLFTVGVLYQSIKLWSRQKRASGQTVDLA
jgi:phosphatidylglycerophosphate synthase